MVFILFILGIVIIFLFIIICKVLVVVVIFVIFLVVECKLDFCLLFVSNGEICFFFLIYRKLIL